MLASEIKKIILVCVNKYRNFTLNPGFIPGYLQLIWVITSRIQPFNRPSNNRSTFTYLFFGNYQWRSEANNITMSRLRE